MDDLVLAAERRELRHEHLDDLAVLDLAQAEHVRPLPPFILLMIFAWFLSLISSRSFVHFLGESGVKSSSPSTLGSSSEIEQILDVPTGDVELAGRGRTH